MAIDLEKVEAALRRAAYKGVHGTREERSGRFTQEGAPTAPNAGAEVNTKKPPHPEGRGGKSCVGGRENRPGSLGLAYCR